jgi:hypothetical protein
MRSRVRGHERVKSPLQGVTLSFPAIHWDSDRGFMGDENSGVRYQDTYDDSPVDMESQIAGGAVELVMKHSG